MMSTVLETRLIPILADHHNSGKSIDILKLSQAYGIDIITATIFGLPCGTNVLQDLEYRDWFFAKFKDFAAAGNSFWLNDVPELTARLQSLGLDPVKPGYYRAKGELEQWCLSLVHAAENLLALNASKNVITPGDKPIVFEKLWLAVDEEAKTNKGSLANSVSLSSAEDRSVEVASECLDHIIATGEDFGAKTLESPRSFVHVAINESYPRHHALLDFPPNLPVSLLPATHPARATINLTVRPAPESTGSRVPPVLQRRDQRSAPAAPEPSLPEPADDPSGRTVHNRPVHEYSPRYASRCLLAQLAPE
jgi:hypothetical protein